MVQNRHLGCRAALWRTHGGHPAVEVALLPELQAARLTSRGALRWLMHLEHQQPPSPAAARTLVCQHTDWGPAWMT